MVKKKSRKKVKRKLIKSKEDKQLAWILIILALIIGGFIVSWFYFQSLKSFEYAGLDWQKEERPGGAFDWYHTSFPTLYNSNQQFTLSLRNNPRENNLPVNVDDWKLTREVIISLEEEASFCNRITLSNAVLTQFITKALGISTKGAVPDLERAEAENKTFANCTSSNQTVILIQKSEQASIEQEGNCYKLNIGECENFLTTERFIIAILEELFEED